MSKMINFGIDLGTTNSLIAKFERGQVEVFKNQNGFKETLPSIIAFRNDRILIGDQAKTYSHKDPKRVASRFKRKMGTTETVKLTNGSKTPVELSAFILKELKTFVHSGEAIEAAVITIPASFDTIQSNATREAGIAAGFKEVVLLQEPIAASLAYANKERNIDLRNSRWMVYDLGGGTFDVALIKIVEGELTVIDHEGDNYLGGTDFDAWIVEQIVVPELEKSGSFNDLLLQMKSDAGRYNTLWYVLLSLAEQAKIELSTKTSSEIDLSTTSIEDEDGTKIEDLFIAITRSQFEGVIKDAVDNTVSMMKTILTRNSLRSEDVDFILMVGGGSYIPFVRKRVEELMNVRVNTSIDPTNAITVGAAYYAGEKEFREQSQLSQQNAKSHGLKIRAAFNRNTQELEESFNARIDGDVAGLFYRITREDGAFDSGLKPLANRITEDLPLREGTFNLFKFLVLDSKNIRIDVGLDSIQIAQGRYSVAGQMLPDDVSLVVDDVSKKDTKLKRIFSRNSILPSKSKTTVEVARTIIKGSADSIQIIVVEGPAERHSTTNKPIARLEVSGLKLNKDLLKGTEIDLTFECSESRDFTVSAYLNGTGQEFSQIFNGTEREVSTRSLATEVIQLEEKLQAEIDSAIENGNHDATKGLEKLVEKVQKLIVSCGNLAEDDVTDDRFKLEDQKRKIAQEVFELTASKRIDAARSQYQTEKSKASILVQDQGNDREKHLLRDLIAREATFINSSNSERIEAAASEMHNLRWGILARTPEFLMDMFEHLVKSRTSMNDQSLANELIDSGRRHIDNQKWEDLRHINARLFDLMPTTVRDTNELRYYTGIL